MIPNDVDATEVYPNLVMASMAGTLALDLTQFDLVVSVCIVSAHVTIPRSSRHAWVYWPMEDKPALPSKVLLWGLAQMVADVLRKGGRVLVHCGEGKNRSGLVAGAALAAHTMSGRSALRTIRGARPGALSNAVFSEYVRTLP